MSKQPPPTASAVGPCPTLIQTGRTPRTLKFARTIAPHDHPRKCSRPLPYCNPNCRTPRHWKFTQHLCTTRPPPLWETARYRLKYCLKGPLNPKQPTNQQSAKLVDKFLLQFHRNVFRCPLPRGWSGGATVLGKFPI